jgi:hypothetical protein
MKEVLTHISSPEDRITSIKHCAPRISFKMATIDEFVLKNIGLWWRYGISRHCDEWKYIIIGRIFESEIMLIPPSLKISEGSYNGSYRNTDEVWWRYGIPIFFKTNSSIVAILKLIRGAQCLIEVIRSSGEEMWRVDAYQIPYYSRGIEEAKRTHPRFADCPVHVSVWSIYILLTTFFRPFSPVKALCGYARIGSSQWP